MGSLIAAYMLRYGWGWSFVVPGAFIAVCGASASGQLLAALRAHDVVPGWDHASARLPPAACTTLSTCPFDPPPAGLIIFSFLVVEPQDIGFLPQSGSVLGSEASALLFAACCTAQALAASLVGTLSSHTAAQYQPPQPRCSPNKPWLVHLPAGGFRAADAPLRGV